MSQKTGIILSLIGGFLSITVFGIFLLVLYPEFAILGRLFMTIFQAVISTGGVITLIGAFISTFAKTENKKKWAWIIVLIGAILGGGNIISIIGAVQLKKSYLKSLSKKDDINKIKCPLCGYNNNINDRICKYCGKELTKGSSTGSMS